MALYTLPRTHCPLHIVLHTLPLTQGPSLVALYTLPSAKSPLHHGTTSTPRITICSCACQATLPCPTGYPFDVPEAGAGIFTYAALAYHLPLMIAFSVKQHIDFVWGGCMLFSRTDMTEDTYGIMQVCALCHGTRDVILYINCPHL